MNTLNFVRRSSQLNSFLSARRRLKCNFAGYLRPNGINTTQNVCFDSMRLQIARAETDMRNL